MTASARMPWRSETPAAGGRSALALAGYGWRASAGWPGGCDQGQVMTRYAVPGPPVQLPHGHVSAADVPQHGCVAVRAVIDDAQPTAGPQDPHRLAQRRRVILGSSRIRLSPVRLVGSSGMVTVGGLEFSRPDPARWGPGTHIEGFLHGVGDMLGEGSARTSGTGTVGTGGGPVGELHAWRFGVRGGALVCWHRQNGRSGHHRCRVAPGLRALCWLDIVHQVLWERGFGRRRRGGCWLRWGEATSGPARQPVRCPGVARSSPGPS
jgi:hypothetical protein